MKINIVAQVLSFNETLFDYFVTLENIISLHHMRNKVNKSFENSNSYVIRNIPLKFYWSKNVETWSTTCITIRIIARKCSTDCFS